MHEPNQSVAAFGSPGISPTWQRGDKDGVGTAYSSSSRVWFTLWNGIVTEVYAPTVDRPQVRDLQVLFFKSGEIIAPETAFQTCIEPIGDSLGYRIHGRMEQPYPLAFEKEVICDPHQSSLLMHFKVSSKGNYHADMKACVLCAPHLGGSGWGNSAHVVSFVGKEVLVAQHANNWLAFSIDGNFSKTSVGYVGFSDGWTDLHKHKEMAWQFRSATDGNVALSGLIDVATHPEFTVIVAFGETQHSALANLLQSMALPYERQRERFLEQWARLGEKFEDLTPVSGDRGQLYGTSVRLLLAHEDKIYPGAMVASLAIPWGEARGDDNGTGAYHLIWTRDLVQSALGLLAAGQVETPLRAFLYLAASQGEDGSFPQNFWVDGTPFWQGLQLDEIAFPIILAHRLWKAGALTLGLIEETALRAVSFLLLAGPVTGQERWEEAEGISPSTLAAVITAMICAAEMAESAGDTREQAFVEEYADWLENQLENWTATRTGTLRKEVVEHYVRINPVQRGKSPADVDSARVKLNNIPPDSEDTFPAKEIIDAGFLELVRYGIRRPDDPLILASLDLVDSMLRVETPSGVLWRRYNNDGYGQQKDGSSYVTFGQGRGWPLLVGERGHYELAAKRDAAEHIRWMEGLTTPTNLLPEQSWDGDETADKRQRPGRPTGSAVPLLWAHAEYIKLLRSKRDGKVFDLNDRVAQRYSQQQSRERPQVQFWSFACPIDSKPRHATLRVVAEAEFELLFSRDGWVTTQRARSMRTKLRLSSVDIVAQEGEDPPLVFTFFWPDSEKWEGKDFQVSQA